MSRPKINLFTGLLFLLLVLSAFPIAVLINRSVSSLNEIENLSNETIDSIVKEERDRFYKARAEDLAQQVAELLKSRELDLETLAQIPQTPEAYLRFSKAHLRGVQDKPDPLPLYKEVAFISANGSEVIKIADNRIVPQKGLLNVSIPTNTTYKSETYFHDTRASTSPIHVSKLTGWYVSRREQVELGKEYSGVIRFCKKALDDEGDFAGIFMLALDHQHLMNFIRGESADGHTLLEDYAEGNYAYLYDEEGWVMAHPKLWDIRGVDPQGIPVPAYTEQTPSWTVEAGMIPLNLYQMDWRLFDIDSGQPISSILDRVQRGEVVLATIRNLGIDEDSEGQVRTRVYAPTPYHPDPRATHPVWGGVVTGASHESFLAKAESFTAVIEDISGRTQSRMILLALFIGLAVVLVSFLVARMMARAMHQLNESLVSIGRKEFDLGDFQSPIKEIEAQFDGVAKLARELHGKDERIRQYIEDLKIVNKKLAETKKELDSHWKKEYEIESDTVLEQKIASYENTYPGLRDIRKHQYLGNSPAFLRVVRQIIPQSQMTMPTWLYGESGVGKTALVRMIHMLSPRRDQPFHVFAASEFSAADPLIVMGKLFGYGAGHGLRGIHEAGQKGVLELCDGGTLFIDDVDALPLDTQSQLLRVVDGLSFHPAAGQPKEMKADVRFLFATHIDLEQRVKEGRFRKDLYRRMGGSYNRILIPPLRERKSDIPLLAQKFIGDHNLRFETNLSLSDDALHSLMRHDYREGNISELKIVCELACENVRVEGDNVVLARHLGSGIKSEREDSSVNGEVAPSGIFTRREEQELAVLRANDFKMESSEIALGFKQGSRTLSHHLRGMCLKALYHSDWDVGRAASLIAGHDDGATQALVRRKIERYQQGIITKSEVANQKSLFTNLPKAYHEFLHRAIVYYQEWSAA